MNSVTELNACETSSRSDQDYWEAEQDCCINPSVVFLCGSVPMDRAVMLQRGVHDRLEPDLQVQAVQWARIPSAEAVTANLVREAIAPFLKAEFWHDLASRGITPDSGVPSIQCVAVYCVQQPSKKGKAVQLLEVLAEHVRTVVPSNFRLLCPLVATVKAMYLEVPDLYWPKLQLHGTTWGGHTAGCALQWQTCENILVALLTSELMRTLGQVNSGSSAWVYVGASALSADASRTREYLRQLILHRLLEPLSVSRLTSSDQQTLIAGARNSVEQYQDSQLLRAAKVIAGLGWIAEIQENAVERLALDQGHKLARSVFPPSTDLCCRLAQHYRVMRDTLTNKIAESAAEQFGRLVESLRLLLDHDFSQKRGPRALPTQAPWSSGPAPALFWLERIVADLKRVAEGYYDRKPLIPHPQVDDYALDALAQADAAALHARYRRYTRLRRAVLSFPALLLMLIPAWPLLSHVFSDIAGWRTGLSMGAAALLLSAIGTTEWVTSRSMLRKRLHAFKQDAQERLARSALAIVTRVLRNDRTSTIRQLEEFQRKLTSMLSLTQRRWAIAQEQEADLLSWYETRSKDMVSIYRLVDFEDCREWANQAMQIEAAADPRFEQATTRILAQHALPPFHSTGSASSAVQDIERLADKLVEIALPEDAPLAAHVLAEREAALSEGKRWRWLYRRARPLNDRRGQRRAFTVVTIAEGSALVGASGSSSQYWDPQWLVTRSRSPYEIIMVHGITEENRQEDKE